jgi:putative ABC transport system permease protein
MWRTITGVAGSVKHQRPTREPVPMIYLPYAQAPSRNMWIAVRTSGDPARLTGVLRATVHAMDSDVLLEEMRTMQQVIEDSLVERKMMAALVAGFAWFALVLATIGIYGVIAYSVSQRTHEIGVRVALGATAQGVVALVLKRGAGLAALGIAIGVPAAWALSRFLASLLYGISPRDCIEKPLRTDVRSEVHDAKTGALHHHRHKILPNIMMVAFHGPDHHGRNRLHFGLGQDRFEDL